jgi:GT2 family glycosyltransferase/cyanophycinase-like exopeptidase
MAGTVTLIGSGEFSTGFVPLYRQLLARLGSPHAVFVETPAGFQTNADELTRAAQTFFQRELNVPLDAAALRHSGAPAGQVQTAKEKIAAANLIVAGPGSPTYAIRHWRATEVGTLLTRRLAEGAQLVFASSAAIAVGRYAVPVYEIYKVGEDPYWAEGLNLLGGQGFELAVVSHWNNRDPRCFIGLERFEALAAQLPPTTVVLGVDENTSVTLDFEARSATVGGAGAVTLQHPSATRRFVSGDTFDLAALTPAGLTTAAHRLSPKPAAPAAPPPSAELYVPEAVRHWAAQRDALRAEKKFAEADRLRERIAALGYGLKDSPAGPLFSLTQHTNSNSLPSQLDKPDAAEWSVVLLAQNNADEVLRAASSALRHGGQHSLVVVIVDDGSNDHTRAALADFGAGEERVRLVHLAGPLGEGAGRNAGLRSARGKFVMILGGHMEITGDVFAPLAAALADEAVGAVGSNALITEDLFTFQPAPTPEADAARLVEADAIEFYLFAFRREHLGQVGWLDEKFVFYRNLDLDWSFAFKDKGLRLVGVPGLPLVVHEHPYLRMDPAERDRLSKKNYRRFLDKWRDRQDLLLKRSSGD